MRAVCQIYSSRKQQRDALHASIRLGTPTGSLWEVCKDAAAASQVGLQVARQWTLDTAAGILLQQQSRHPRNLVAASQLLVVSASAPHTILTLVEHLLALECAKVSAVTAMQQYHSNFSIKLDRFETHDAVA